ncbi:Holliday junction branch migration DNA helicase RuvB [Mycoplasmopsis hyopharyngis]|uniref:Holliday junction branch migration DNA helicase RuvB n=1 Tax=Mycoplasmopsis hyopharyngis TaxID=29558 RepID=UPI003872EB27
MNQQLLNLRPNNFNDFIGQEKLKSTLETMIFSAKKQQIPLDHILLYGPPGTGKTTLASIISEQVGARIHYLQGSLLDKKSDILSIFANVQENDIIFIDEIHSINKNLEELIYNAMEDFKIDLILGPDGNSKAIRMKLKPFTLIGATTRLNLLSQPLKDRFGLKAHISNYTIMDIEKIINKSKQKMNIVLEKGVVNLIAKYSRFTPRIANNLLKRINDFSIRKNEKTISIATVVETFKHIELFENGLNREHLDYLKLLIDVFDEKWASLDSIAGILNNSKELLINEIEPILLNLKLIEKSSRGRRITILGIDYLLKNKNANLNNEFYA